MTGLFLQRVVVAALLAVTLLLTSSIIPISQHVAFAATTDDTEAGGSKSETDSKKDSEPKPTETEDKEEADKPDELPPLDLGTGTVPTDDTETEDVLADGVTATASSKSEETSTQPASGASGDPLDPLKLWTPNSGRFLLKDRQSGLALASSADTEDKGDGNTIKVTQPKDTKPVGVKPVLPTKPVTENTNPEDQPSFEHSGFELPEESASDYIPSDLPNFVSEVEVPQIDRASVIEEEVIVDENSQIDGSETGDLDNGSQLIFGLNDDEPTVAGASEDDGVTGVIRQNYGSEDDTQSGSEGSIFKPNSELGENVVSVSPWRGLSVTLFVLGLIFIAYWIAQKFKGRMGGLTGKTLSVIETIGIGAGRQIIIIEMNDDALILGVTPNSINLLDKVPLTTLNNGYSTTVDGIISREGTALPGQWESRPRFDSAISSSSLAPPIQSGAYSSTGQTSTSVAELRKTRQVRTGARAVAQVAEPPNPINSKDELLGKFRSQLNRFEE